MLILQMDGRHNSTFEEPRRLDGNGKWKKIWKKNDEKNEFLTLLKHFCN